jgi:hypothetical protein
LYRYNREKVRDCATAAVFASGEQGRSPRPRRLLDAATVGPL